MHNLSQVNSSLAVGKPIEGCVFGAPCPFQGGNTSESRELGNRNTLGNTTVRQKESKEVLGFQDWNF